nr:MAG TPA: hypothetical protein [Herelleviridae sp.]
MCGREIAIGFHNIFYDYRKFFIYFIPVVIRLSLCTHKTTHGWQCVAMKET